MSIEISISSSDVIYYIVIITVAFIGGFIGAEIGYLLARISQQREIRARGDIEGCMNKEFPYIKDKVEHRDHRLDD